MNRRQATAQTKEPIVEYRAAENESNILNLVFNKLFEQVEKELVK